MLSRRFIFALPIFLLVYILQEGFVVQMRFPAGGFSLFLIFSLLWAGLSTPEIGALTGFGAGLLMDLSQTSPGPLGHWMLVMITTCYLIAFLGYGDDNMRANPFSIVLLVTGGVVLSQFLFLFLGLLLGQDIGSIRQILFVFAGTAFWTAIISPLILPMVSFLHASIFGTRNRI
jgi:rod shape-determining protein MreD